MFRIGDEIEKAYCEVGVAFVLAEEVFREDVLDDPAAGALNEAINRLHGALDILMKLKSERPPITQTIFPTIGAATTFLAGLPKGGDIHYQICCDGAGRCVIKRLTFDTVL